MFSTQHKPHKITLIKSEPNSRYKVTQLQITHHGRDKMVKTHFENIETVASDLHVDSTWLLAYIGYALNTFGKCNDGVYWVAGGYHAAELSDIIEKFIQEIILCPVCNLPELKYSTREKIRGLYYACDACGKVGLFNFTNEKFEKFILNKFVK